MTNERKIEILTRCKVLILRGDAICTAFFKCCIGFEIHGDMLTIKAHLGDVFEQHKPKNKDVNELWFPLEKQFEQKRIEIIDKMIHELKQLIP